MILAISVVVDESKCLEIPIWEFLTFVSVLPFSLGYKLIASAACPSSNLEMITTVLCHLSLDLASVNTA